jgi:hypothetical protein
VAAQATRLSKGPTLRCSELFSKPSKFGGSQCKELDPNPGARAYAAKYWSTVRTHAVQLARCLLPVLRGFFHPPAEDAHSAVTPREGGFGFRGTHSVVFKRWSVANPQAAGHGLVHPAGTSRTNLADALGLISRWRLSKP